MRILGFDTATASTTVALVDPDTGLELEQRDDPPRGERPRHATALLGLIEVVLRQAGGGWEAVERIAVGVGPGTFTGLRIGIATARAIGQSRGIPLRGVSTLESLALNAHQARAADTVLALLDARRGQAFAAAWRLGDREQPVLVQRLLEPSALDPAELDTVVHELGGDPLAIGSGAVEFRSALERSGALVPADDSPLHKVTSLHHCRLAAGGVSTPEAELLPEYLRLPDAELARRRQ